MRERERTAFGARLYEARTEAKLKQPQLAKIVGMGQSTLAEAEWSAQGSSFTAQLAQACGVRPEWLASGALPKRAPVPPPPSPTPDQPEYAGRPRAARMIAVVGTAKMGENGYYEEISSIPGAGDGHLAATSDDPQAYVLRVRGRSMHPAIRDGWYVLVEPQGRCASGEPVLVKLKNGHKMVKEFLFERADAIELESVNGGERLTIYRADLESMQPVAGIFPPSKWQPE